MNNFIRLAICIALFISFSVPGFARRFYVSSSYSGTVSNGSQSNPWKSLSSLQANMSILAAGDTISFLSGDIFPGTLTISKSGNATAPLVFNAYGSGVKPKLTGTGTTITNLIYAFSKSYLVFDGLMITDPPLESDVNRLQLSRIQRAINLDQSTYCTVKNCEISLVGTGIYTPNGGYHLIDNNKIYNLRMIVNTNDGSQPGNDDDYGANPVTLDGSNNTVTHNLFYGAWAQSFDYNFDGGAVEMFDEGSGVSNNFIAYNTFYDCIGVLEVKGVCNNNKVVYNKFINNGSFAYFHTGCTGWAIENNVFVETVQPRLAEAYLIGGRSGYTTDLILKNNVFQLSTGTDVANASRFNPFNHSNNIFKLSNNSITNFALGSTESLTTAAFWTNTTSADPVQWDMHPLSNGVLINTGAPVGLTKDFSGQDVASPPEIGLLEWVAAAPVLNATGTNTPISCNGGNSTVTIAATGGTPPYTGTGNFTVSAGTYNFIVTDAAGGKDTVTLNIAQPTVISATVTTGTITVPGGTTTVQVAATGGAGSTYNYSIDGGVYQASNTFNNVPSGNHYVNVRDVNGCVIQKSFFINAPVVSPLIVTAVAGAITCFGGTTSATVSASGGLPPYTGTGNFVVSSGTSSFTVQDAYGQTQVASVIVTQPTDITIVVNGASNLTGLGSATSISITATGGTGSFKYGLDGGALQNSNTFRGVTAGTHNVLVVDANNCSKTQSFFVGVMEYAGLQLNLLSKTNVTCLGGKDGFIEVLASGGTSPYQYAIGNGLYGINNKFYNLKAGTYRVKSKDANRNVAEITVQILDGLTACTGRESVSLEVNTYPNPSASGFSIQVQSVNDQEIVIEVMDMFGKRMYMEKGFSGKVFHFGEQLKPGSYFVKVTQGNVSKTQKVIKF